MFYLLVRGKVTRQCPQTTTSEEKEDPSSNRSPSYDFNWLDLQSWSRQGVRLSGLSVLPRHNHWKRACNACVDQPVPDTLRPRRQSWAESPVAQNKSACTRGIKVFRVLNSDTIRRKKVGNFVSFTPSQPLRLYLGEHTIRKKKKKSIRQFRAETHTDMTHESQQQNYSQTMSQAEHHDWTWSPNDWVTVTPALRSVYPSQIRCRPYKSPLGETINRGPPCTHAFEKTTYARLMSCSPCQSSVDHENIRINQHALQVSVFRVLNSDNIRSK